MSKSEEVISARESVYDVILRRGMIVDGSGCPAFEGDLAIQAERIVRISDLDHARAIREIDVTGLVVAPGFIDVHTHDDAALITRPEMTPKLTQGVTTVIGGNCGISAAPYRRAGEPPDLLHLIFKSERYMAETLDQYLHQVEEAAPAINAAFLTGHTTLRMQVMGEQLNRVATDTEIAAMRDLLTECMEQGSLGLSTGLFYPPARAASTDEVIAIAQPLSAYGGLYVTHMRDEADQVIESLEESLSIGRAIGAPVMISHHKCMGRQNFGRSVETLALLKAAQAHQRVAMDVYPYTAGSSILNAEFLKHSQKTIITWCDPYPQFRGRELNEVAGLLRCTVAEAVSKLQPAGAIYFTMDEADVTRILCAPEAMVGSDGLPDDEHPHPRLWGTFPRVLGRYVRERQVLSLEDAIHRMTGLSAHHFGLRDRGLIRVGNYADLCVFDPLSVCDTATFETPISRAVGVHYVFVNGQLALERGIPTNNRAGKVLRRMSDGTHTDAGVSVIAHHRGGS